ncbi:MAG: MOSC N-terminal beta barrel domain-containing protein, partial [Actinomycetota bacterium]
MPTVASLNVTPVKSTRVNRPVALRIEVFGAVGDRDFFFVDPAGRRVSASSKAPMQRVSVTRDDTADELTFRFPDGSSLTGPAAGDGDALT